MSEACPSLPAKPVQGTARLLEGEDHIKCSHSLAAAVLSVSDGIANQALQEELQDRAGLLIDCTRNALDTSTACQAANSGLKKQSQLLQIYLL